MTLAETRALRRLVSRFKGKRILVVGDLMLDQYIRGSVSRISPEAPVPVVMVGQETFIPGGAGNVAHNLAALDACVTVMGVVGADEAGARLTSDLSARGVDISSVIADSTRVTSQKCRVVAERQQVIRYDRETSAPLDGKIEEELLRRLPETTKTAQAVILSDYGKGVVTPRILNEAIRACKKADIPIIVDPKIENFMRYRGVSCITPNVHEAWAGMRRKPVEGLAALVDLGRSILKRLKCGSLLITRGPDGMSLFKADGQVIHIPTQAREVYDVTGAGDTVIAALTLGLAGGASIKRAAELSNIAAGIVVGKLGTATANLKELSAAIR